ncbi:polysaccharide pyruvyl transferase family protein [Mycobacterium deserti]|uniref:Polysaccharide pyruvyl transferase family protein n=1 Tax=Mycobacterium deserti TaxID=2978347 RepID=A0ABT2M529_9MYCO|nr:polysaccharide pyruvyl transferase family protein [Mycobacterium deserti]MCT7657364.1 polysaccharide pyruvyl transferase family protein [Mycobacterium deserti]
MIVDIRGTNTRNKGAQLMLQAACERIGDLFELSVPPLLTDRTVRADLGLRTTLCDPVVPRMSSFAGNIVPSAIRHRRGLTSDREIGGVLDASGFHYSDQFPVAYPRRSALAGRSWQRRRIPKILLPQAFGPFDKPGTRRWSEEALEQAQLIFARDDVSEQYVRTLRLSTPILRSPDFTIGLKPRPIAPVSNDPFLAVVPNTKLFTHGGLNRARYVQLLAGLSRAARAEGLTTLVIVHEETDHDIAKEVSNTIGARVLRDADPLVLKAALGQASAAVASRFHALVGCLSQSIPTLSLGWSHKYRELLNDFGVADRVLAEDSDPRAAIQRILSDSAGNTRQKERQSELSDQVDVMWERTINALNGP